MRISKNLLWRYFSGHVTPPERQRIAEWLREESSLEQYYEALEEWEAEHLQFETDSEAALARYLSENPVSKPVQEGKGKPNPVFSFSANRFGWLTAAVVVLAAVGLYTFRDFFLYQTYTTGYGQVRPLILDDGSRVTLNANSSLSIPRWRSDDREVFLKGEAEFSVVHTHDHRRFLVKTNDQLQVEVLGTEFVVYSREKGSKVALTKGKVRLSSLKENPASPLTIAPGDVVTVDAKGAFNLQTGQSLERYTAWKNHLFVFDRTPLSDITTQIEETFGVTVRVRDAGLAQRNLTGSFEAETADELLEVLTTVMNLRQAQKTDRSVILTTGSD